MEFRMLNFIVGHFGNLVLFTDRDTQLAHPLQRKNRRRTEQSQYDGIPQLLCLQDTLLQGIESKLPLNWLNLLPFNPQG